MTGQERDFEEILSRVLHTTTDPIEPVGDGLTKIRERLTEPWLKRQFWLLRSELVVLGWLVVVRCESFLATVRAASAVTAGAAGEPAAQPHTGPEAGTAEAAAGHGGRLRWLWPVLAPVAAWAAATRLGKAGGPLRRSVGPAVAWLRPALAVAGAVVLVVAGVFALGPMRGAILGLENATEPGTSASSNGNGSGNPAGSGSRERGSKAGTPAHGRSGSARPGSTSRSKVAPSPSSCSSPSTPPVNSPSPTPTPTSPSPTPTSPSPTPTSPSPTPTATATTTNGPMVAGTHNWSIKTTAFVACQQTAPASPPNQATPGP